MMDLIEHELQEYNMVICNPNQCYQRGGHIYLEHREAARICRALKARLVTPDFRTPSSIRLAPVALYNSFKDVYNCVQVLREIIKYETYKKFENVREVVS